MIVGTAGHIDHGKTALVKALTGVDADRLKEEKERGITVDLGFAYWPSGEGRVTGFIDVPGHEKLVHTMMAGASGIDLALLVIAADDGVMPQTREHIAILDLLGIRRGLVALSKADLADEGRRLAVEAEIAAALAGTGLAGAPVLPVSSVSGEGIAALKQALQQAERDTAERPASAGRFRLAVDRSFTLAGTGTVVTGTVMAGTVRVGDQVVVSPSGLAARVRSIHAQNRPAEQGIAGQRCALNLAGPGVEKTAIARGDVVLDPSLHAPTDRIDVELSLLATEAKPIGTWFAAHFHHGSTDVGARIVPLGDPVKPGTSGFAQVVLDRPIAAAVGDRFVLRDASARRTIGGGRLLDLRAPARKRRTPERLAQLEALRADDPQVSLAALLELPPFVVDLDVFAWDHGLAAVQADALQVSSGAVVIEAEGRRLALSRSARQHLSQSLLGVLSRFHDDNAELQGMGRERLRLSTSPRLPAKAFTAVLQAEAQAGQLVLDGAFVRLPGHSAKLGDGDAALWASVAPHLGGEARFRPPRVRDLAGLLDEPEPDIRRVLKLCARIGHVDQIAHDHFFLRATTAEMVALACEAAAEGPRGEFTAAAFRDRMDNGRKVAIQILDFFDRHGVTLRRGDLRRMNPHRLDLFGTAVSGREAFPVGRPDFKSGWGSETVPGGFDSRSLPPPSKTP